MTLLNQTSDGLLPAMLVLRRALLAFGPMRRETLEALCAPPTLGKQIHERQLLHKTLMTWTGLGMFAADDEQVRLLEPFADIGIDDIDLLRNAVLRQLMRRENVPSLTEDGDKDVSRASDFARCASWLLAQDPYRVAASNEGSLQKASDEQQTSPQVFPGSGRWTAFKSWGYFTGLGIPTAHGFLINPARAIRAQLDEMIPPGVEETAEAFVRRLASQIPVLDWGDYRQTVESQTGKPWREFAADEVSPTLSLALAQLNHEVELVLEDRPGDVAGRLTLLGRRGRPWRWFSHVRRGAPVWRGAARRT